MLPTDADRNLSDAELEALLLRLREGESAAFERLFWAIHRSLRIQIAARVPLPDLIDEVLQRALIAIWEAGPRYQPQGKPWAWLRTITRNQLASALQQRSQEARSLRADLDAWLGETALDEEADADAAAQASDLAARLARCFEQLGDRSRQLLRRHHVDGEPLKKLAQRFKKKERALAMSLYRLRARLRACAEEGRSAP